MPSATNHTPPPADIPRGRVAGKLATLAGRSEEGQALVEFALLLPAVVLIMFGSIHLGLLAVNGKTQLTHLTNEGARAAAVNGSCFELKNLRGVWAKGTTYKKEDVVEYKGAFYISVVEGNLGHDPGSDGGVHWKLLSPGTCPVGVREEAAFLKWLTAQGDTSLVKNATATMCSPTSKLGDYVEVKLTYNYKPLAIFGLKVAEIPVTAAAQMRIEREPANPYPGSC